MLEMDRLLSEKSRSNFLKVRVMIRVKLLHLLLNGYDTLAEVSALPRCRLFSRCYYTCDYWLHMVVQ